MIKQVIHACNISGISDLMFQNNNYEYLCCSSLNCPDFFHRDVLFLIEGNVVREYNGDIGCIGMSAKNTNYDELHIEGEFEIIGLYIPDNMEYFDLYKYAVAKTYINDILELPIDIINANKEQLKIIKEYEEEISLFCEEDYNEVMGIEIENE